MPIRFRNVGLKIDRKKILENISFEIQPNTVTAILGPSGSGKSSILKLVLGLLKPNTGTITINNEAIDFANVFAHRRRLGYAVQGSSLFPHLSVIKNITLVAKLCGWSKLQIDSQLQKTIEFVQLETSLLKKYPHELSGGEAQRVGLARALFLDAKILLLDEPFAALDAGTKGEIHKFFKTMQTKNPKAIILVTHDLNEARYLSGDCIFIKKGRLLTQGKYEDIEKEHGEDFIKSFFL